MVSYLLPRGLLYEIMDKPVIQADARRANRKWFQNHGGAVPPPDPEQRLAVRSAWSRVYLHRAEYFNILTMWPEAVGSAKAAVEWMPEQAIAWYSLGFAQLQLGNEDQASASLQQALNLDPEIAGPRTALASLALQREDRVTARQLLIEELERHPDDRAAQAFWQHLQGMSAP